ncbi:hypothetical protein ACOMHN_049283 [Nucella lapillus]
MCLFYHFSLDLAFPCTIVDRLHRLGFSLSYNEVKLFEMCATVQQGTDLVGVDPKTSWIQFAADNVDHQIRTLDGIGTFHGMGIIGVATPGTKECRAVRRDTSVTDGCELGGIPFCEEQTRNATAVIESLSETKLSRCLNSKSKTIIYTGQCRFNQVIFSTFFRKTYQKVYTSIFLVCFVIVFFLYICIYRSVIVRRSRRLRARQKNSSRFRRDTSYTETVNSTSRVETPSKKMISVEASQRNMSRKESSSRKKGHGTPPPKYTSQEDDSCHTPTTPLPPCVAAMKTTSSEEALLQYTTPTTTPNTNTSTTPTQAESFAQMTVATTTSENVVEMTVMPRNRRTNRLASDNSGNNALKEKYLLANLRTAVMLFVVTVVFVLAFLPSWLMAHGVVHFHAVVFYGYFIYNVSNPIIYAFINPTFRKELKDVVRCHGLFRGRSSSLRK